MHELFSGFVALLRKELENPEWKKEVLRPLMKWLLYSMMPYALGLICVNFFLTIAAVSLVLYIYRR